MTTKNSHRDKVLEVKDLFNAKAKGWSRKYEPAGPLTFRVEAFKQVLGRHLLPNSRVLDFGCGTGAIASALVENGLRVAACDVAGEMIAAGKQIYARLAIEWLLLPANWKQLPFEASSFDAIVASSVFEYLSDVNAVLRECHRILKPGGFLVATVPNPRSVVRKLENVFRPVAVLADKAPLLNRVSKLRLYAAYLKCSRNRLPMDDWFALASRAHFAVVDEDKIRASKTALIFLVLRKTK